MIRENEAPRHKHHDKKFKQPLLFTYYTLYMHALITNFV